MDSGQFEGGGGGGFSRTLLRLIFMLVKLDELCSVELILRKPISNCKFGVLLTHIRVI